MPTEEQTERFQMRVSPAFLRLVDEWRRQQPDLPSRAEAIRRLVERGIAAPEKLSRRRPQRGQ
jgi:hypothetical protein